MSLLSGILKGVGVGDVLQALSLFGGVQNDQRVNSERNRAMQQYEEGKKIAGDSYRSLAQNYENRLAQGAFNADAAIRLAQEDAARTAKVGGSNIAARLGGLGYKKGDAKPNQELRQFSEKSQIELANRELAIRDAYDQKRLNELYNVANAGRDYAGYVGGLGDKYSNQANMLASRGGGVAQSLAALASMGGQSQQQYTPDDVQKMFNAMRVAGQLGNFKWS